VDYQSIAVVFDTDTNNLLKDPLYVSWQERRVGGNSTIDSLIGECLFLAIEF